MNSRLARNFMVTKMWTVPCSTCTILKDMFVHRAVWSETTLPCGLARAHVQDCGKRTYNYKFEEAE